MKFYCIVFFTNPNIVQLHVAVSYFLLQRVLKCYFVQSKARHFQFNPLSYKLACVCICVYGREREKGERIL